MKERKDMEREKRFKLIAAREAKGISQGQLADMLYIGQSGMSRIESGKNGITEKQAKILTEKLGIGADDLNELSLTGEFKSKTSAMKKELREIKERK